MTIADFCLMFFLNYIFNRESWGREREMERDRDRVRQR